MNRRNVLIGLGTAVVGGGAAFGSGAFTNVEAERTVDLQTSGDGSAQVQLSVSDGLSSGGDTIELSEQDINADAITRYNGGLTITVPSGTDGSKYDVYIENPSENSLLKTSADTSDTGSAIQFVGSTDPETLDTSGGSDDSVTLDVVINSKTITSGGSDIGPDTITIRVEDTS
ncbi:hypothetical protein [Halostella salina]|uniref:hypothetical protein n=1 Tax=Halostella salina TaxID=1547897 RepID=UPI0013CF1EB1|nr:hypothetical protein [Halostella salina]